MSMFPAMMKKLFSAFVLAALISGCSGDKSIGKTEITKWQYGKKGAVSITYDDGSSNQFSKALPVMRRLKVPATFFIITGQIAESHYQGKFIGRPVEEIIGESGHTTTNESNFFERASAARYLGYQGTLAYYDRIDALYERGKKEAAYLLTDTLYEKVRSHAFAKGHTISNEEREEQGLTWDSLRQYASEGYEPASHTVTHAHLAVLDTTNMLYELGKSKEDIREHLGDEYTFSAEVPYGIEDPRVMKTAFTVYPALRNSMPDSFMKEINRGDRTQPGDDAKEYVQWQRGPLTKTPMTRMKSWVDTTLNHSNIWLVLVFHGIDDIGWEALTHQQLDTCFQYIKERDDSLWIATFGEVARYLRERMSADVKTEVKENEIVINLTHSLDKAMYKVPLTLKTYLPEGWNEVQVQQGNQKQSVSLQHDEKGSYVLYQAVPNGDPVRLVHL